MTFSSYTKLEILLNNNVCELFIKRRNPVKGRPSFRRMLCTRSRAILMSDNGKYVLGYRPPVSSKPMNFDPRKKRLVIAWDILMQDYRCINYEECYLIRNYPVAQAREFWKAFNKTYLPMTPAQKMQFMDS